MDLATIIDGAGRFVAYVEELTSVIGHADRALPLRDYCAGLLTAEGRMSVEPSGDGAGPSFGSASEALALRRRRKVVGRHRAGQGARACDTGNRASRTDQGVDYR